MTADPRKNPSLLWAHGAVVGLSLLPLGSGGGTEGMRPPATAGRHQDCDRLRLLCERALACSQLHNLPFELEEHCERPLMA